MSSFFKTKLRINTKKYFDGNFDHLFLITFIIVCSYLCDKFIPNSLLTPILLISILLSAILTGLGVNKLKSLKLKQIIRIEGPENHFKKEGTPTMGGILIIPLGLILGNILTLEGESSQKIFTISILILAYMIIGGIDDWSSLINKTNKGLNAKNKIFLQFIVGSIFIGFVSALNWLSPNINILGSYAINIGILILPLGLFVLLAQSNATNLTDGLDGLASGCGALVFAGLAFHLMISGDNGDPALAAFSMTLSGVWLGFLIHNKNPAKIFMGDTGSLAMGAGLSGISLLSNSLWALFLMGGIFFIESISVILQVVIFKITKKANGSGYRMLKMAPLHHHFELKGINETTIVRNFWLISVGLVLTGLIFSQ